MLQTAQKFTHIKVRGKIMCIKHKKFQLYQSEHSVVSRAIKFTYIKVKRKAYQTPNYSAIPKWEEKIRVNNYAEMLPIP